MNKEKAYKFIKENFEEVQKILNEKKEIQAEIAKLQEVDDATAEEEIKSDESYKQTTNSQVDGDDSSQVAESSSTNLANENGVNSKPAGLKKSEAKGKSKPKGKVNENEDAIRKAVQKILKEEYFKK